MLAVFSCNEFLFTLLRLFKSKAAAGDCSLFGDLMGSSCLAMFLFPVVLHLVAIVMDFG